MQSDNIFQILISILTGCPETSNICQKNNSECRNKEKILSEKIHTEVIIFYYNSNTSLSETNLLSQKAPTDHEKQCLR